jgi:hypothetical protein
MMKAVYVSADTNCSGIEVKSPEGLEMIQPSELGLSPRLCSDIFWWQKWFDGVFNLTADHVERFRLLGQGFDEIGKLLADRVQQELGSDWQVLYEPQGGWRLARPNDVVEPIQCRLHCQE